MLQGPQNGGISKNGESDAFFELQDSHSVASYSETDDAGAHECWWKPSSPLGPSTPGAEFYDAFEGTYQLLPLPNASSHFCSNAVLYWDAFGFTLHAFLVLIIIYCHNNIND
jgi:hypothetical protein